MNFISVSQQAKASNDLKTDYPLLEELMAELQIFKQVVLPKSTQAANPTTKLSIEKASDDFKKAIADLVGHAQKSKRFTFKITRYSRMR